MEEDKDILKQIGHRDGMTAPDGYFADFAARMAASLEPTPFEESASPSAPDIKISLWQRVRPYVYMAAMFMGVWCMLKIFTTLTAKPEIPWQPSPIMAEALGNEMFVNDYIIDELNQWELMDDLMEEGLEPTDLPVSDDMMDHGKMNQDI